MSQDPRFVGLRLLVSAGPTYEDIDPVRFLGNRSSGKMGFAIAAEGAALGAEVTLIAGPVTLPTPAGVRRRIDVRRALEMRAAVLAELPGQDAYIAAAAVADYMPEHTAAQKIKKTGDTLTLILVKSPDILAEVANHADRPRCVVGFAAETAELERYALGKLREKRLDMIAANDVSQSGTGFECDHNALTVFSAEGKQEIPHGSKADVARALLALVAQRLARTP